MQYKSLYPTRMEQFVTVVNSHIHSDYKYPKLAPDKRGVISTNASPEEKKSAILEYMGTKKKLHYDNLLTTLLPEPYKRKLSKLTKQNTSQTTPEAASSQTTTVKVLSILPD